MEDRIDRFRRDRLAALCKDADPELQPVGKALKARMARLSGES